MTGIAAILHYPLPGLDDIDADDDIDSEEEQKKEQTEEEEEEEQKSSMSGQTSAFE